MSDERDEARWWIATPECGETSRRHIENLLARLSAVEAERDAARQVARHEADLRDSQLDAADARVEALQIGIDELARENVRAEARAEALSEALRQIADEDTRNHYVWGTGERPDRIARDALAALPERQEQP